MASSLENEMKSYFEATDPVHRAASDQNDLRKIWEIAGLRPTRQRMLLGWLLFADTSRHLTAEMLYEEATQANIKVSLATVYNTLNHLTHAGLLRQVGVDGAKTYFDTNLAPHQHYYFESAHELVDMPESHWVDLKPLHVPVGYEISRIDVIVRLRSKR